MGLAQELAQERASAEAALAAAERAMLDHARDPALFQRSAQEMVKAEAELRRIDFAEKHAAELAEREATAGQRKQLVEAQSRAHIAHKHAENLATRLQPMIDSLEALVGHLKADQVLIDRGVHYEQYGVRDGLIPRVTVAPKLSLDAEQAVRLLRAARDLVKLTPLSPQLAEQRASQRSA